MLLVCGLLPVNVGVMLLMPGAKQTHDGAQTPTCQRGCDVADVAVQGQANT